MYYDLLEAELLKQKDVYLAVKAGNWETVGYKEYHDPVYGTQDANDTNRLRLAYYLLYSKVDDEAVIARLFEEELEDRETNSFQGIGATLEILTFLLKKYNGGHRYDALFARAKKANFDCACGYSTDLAMIEELSDNDLLDCIYLCQDMEFKGVMEPLVEQWKASVPEWGDSERRSLIQFYSFMGKEEENEVLYLEQAASAKQAGRRADVVRAYSDLIRHYLKTGKIRMAHRYLDEVRGMAECPEIRRVRLMGDLLEEAFEVVWQEREEEEGDCCKTANEEETHSAGGKAEKVEGKTGKVEEKTGREEGKTGREEGKTGKIEEKTGREEGKTERADKTKELWEWAKEELKAMTNRYGNLYQKGIAAAKAMEDSYAAQLEKEYKEWWNKWHLE